MELHRQKQGEGVVHPIAPTLMETSEQPAICSAAAEKYRGQAAVLPDVTVESTRNRRRLRSVAALLVGLGVACSEGPTELQPGTIRVSVDTSGGDADTDGYRIVVGARAEQTIAAAGAVDIPVDAGTHTVTLEGVAENCTVNGPGALSVTVPAGGSVNVTFAVVCASTGVEIATRTTGSDTQNSYPVFLNEQQAGVVAGNGSLRITRLPPGTQPLRLAIPNNCNAVGGNQISVQVSNREVTPVLFQITCAPPIRPDAIAYAAYGAGSPRSVVRLVQLDGSGEVEVGVGYSPAWSPGGSRLVFSTTECDFYGYSCTGGLVIADPETRTETPIPNGGSGSSPSWAPTGDVIAFTRRFARSPLRLIRPDGSPAMPVDLPLEAVGVRWGDEPNWSPDGQTIAFTCYVEPQHSDVCVINRHGTGLVRLTRDAANERSPAWSADGSTIAFTTITPGLRAQITLMAADGSAIRRLTAGDSPAWSPKGTKLVFAGDNGLFTINADGSELERLTTGQHFDPAWRP